LLLILLLLILLLIRRRCSLLRSGLLVLLRALDALILRP
jgi:hypothetical protein